MTSVRIKSVELTNPQYCVETEEGGYYATHYRSQASCSWTVVLGESVEQEYNDTELEEAFQAWIAANPPPPDPRDAEIATLRAEVAEAKEQCRLRELAAQEKQRGGEDRLDAPVGWIGPVEAARLSEKVRELRAEVKRLKGERDSALHADNLGQAEVERLREALERIQQWSEAYPLAVFPEPDFKKAHEVLTAHGMTLDAISASNMRHCVRGVGNIARAALEQKP